jgi:hypothetical protein
MSLIKDEQGFVGKELPILGTISHANYQIVYWSHILK